MGMLSDTRRRCRPAGCVCSKKLKEFRDQLNEDCEVRVLPQHWPVCPVCLTRCASPVAVCLLGVGIQVQGRLEIMYWM